MPDDEVLGIDVAARRGCDVVALGADLVARPLGVVHDASELRELLARRPAPPRVVGIDAPRAWAVSGRRRAGECALRARGLTLYSTPDASRADHPFYAWMRTGFDLYRAVDPSAAFEVYPYATAVALRGERPPTAARAGVGKREWRRGALDHAGVDTRALRTVDEVDAGLAALTAWYVLTGRAEVLGEPHTEAIAVPLGLPASG